MSLKQEIRNLAEQYERRAVTCRNMLSDIPLSEKDSDKAKRLLAKGGCYEATAAELRQLLKPPAPTETETCIECGSDKDMNGEGWLCDKCEFTER